MANEQGRYVGETITGVIGEDVGLGQILYCVSISGSAPPDLLYKGIWKVASADLGDISKNYNGNWQIDNPNLNDGWEYSSTSNKQLGVALQAASYSTISSTQSGTSITILLKGYYSPGLIQDPAFGQRGYCDGNITEGRPVYLMPSWSDGASTDTKGCLSQYQPLPLSSYTWASGATYSSPTGSVVFKTSCATQSIGRVVGYAWDTNYPYVIRFEPEKSWYEYRREGTASAMDIRLNGAVTINGFTPS